MDRRCLNRFQQDKHWNPSDPRSEMKSFSFWLVLEYIPCWEPMCLWNENCGVKLEFVIRAIPFKCDLGGGGEFFSEPPHPLLFKRLLGTGVHPVLGTHVSAVTNKQY